MANGQMQRDEISGSHGLDMPRSCNNVLHNAVFLACSRGSELPARASMHTLSQMHWLTVDHWAVFSEAAHLPSDSYLPTLTMISHAVSIPCSSCFACWMRGCTASPQYSQPMCYDHEAPCMHVYLQNHTFKTFSFSRLKSCRRHSYTAPSAPAVTSRWSSGDHITLRTLPLWPLQSAIPSAGQKKRICSLKL